MLLQKFDNGNRSKPIKKCAQTTRKELKMIIINYSQVTDLDAPSYASRDPAKVLVSHEQQKKKKYLEDCPFNNVALFLRS